MLKARLWRVTYDYNTGTEGGKIQEEFRKKETARLFISRLADFNGISNVQLKRVRAQVGQNGFLLDYKFFIQLGGAFQYKAQGLDLFLINDNKKATEYVAFCYFLYTSIFQECFLRVIFSPDSISRSMGEIFSLSLSFCVFKSSEYSSTCFERA